MKLELVFSGRIHPERAIVNIRTVGARLRLSAVSGERYGELATDICFSQISALFYNYGDISLDIFTMKNLIEDAIRLQVDALGYSIGCGYDVEITQAVNIETEEHTVFGVNIPILQNRATVDAATILQLCTTEDSDFIRRALADLRGAIRSPHDTGELCYRAIETLRKFFAKKCNLDDNDRKDCNKAWEQLRTELGIDRADIDAIGRFAVDKRHGGTVVIADVDRQQIFSISWNIMDKFIKYAENGYQRC